MLDPRFYKANGPISLSELIDGLDVDLAHEKFSDELITGGAILAGSKAGHICFFNNKRHISQVETAKATACFVPERMADILGQKHIIPIISKTPKAHFGRVIKTLVTSLDLHTAKGVPTVAKSANVHATAILGAGAVIGEDVVVSPYAVIGPGVHVGAGTYIGPHAHIEYAILGQDCKIKANAVIGGAGFGVSADENGILDIPHIGRVIIGDRVTIGSHSAVDRGQLGDTELADDVKVDNLVQIAHNVKIGAGTFLAGQVGISGSCIIGKGAKLGGAVGLADNIKVGDGAFVAARSGVMHDIPPGETWSGIPAMPIREHMRLVSATRKLSRKSKV